MPRSSRWFSVRLKILSSSLAVLLPISAFIYFYFPAREEAIALEALRARTRNMAEFVALGVGRGLQLNEFPDVVAAVNWVKEDSSLAYVVVVDSAGDVFASYNPRQVVLDIPRELTSVGMRRADARLATTVPIVFDGRNLGSLLLGVSLDPLERQIADERELALWIGIVVVIAGGLVSRTFAKRITDPLVELQGAAEAVADGNYDVIIRRGGDDEVGALADGFSVMVENLRDSTRRLSGMVSDLAAARDAAQASERTKSYFLATMSHEIRTPMNGVIGMLGLLGGTGLTAQQRRFAETATRSADSLLELIDDILDFSKIEAGRLEVHRADFDLQETIEDIGEMLAPSAHQKSVDLVVRIAPDVHPHVHGDGLRIRQVLINLVGNAVKFTNHGTVDVRATVERRTDEGQVVRIEVQDTGIGIPPDALKLLFSPFVQADSSTTRHFGGSGLGLAIAKQLVELMGGQMGVHSAVGEGSTFSVTLPLASRPVPSDAPAVELPLLGGKHLLIVDDNASDREALRERLGLWGATIDLASDGAEGLALLHASESHRPYDALILDFTLPSLNGGEVATGVRASAATRALPIVMLSSVHGPEGIAEASTLVDATLPKPLRQRDLAAVLVSIFGSEVSPPRRRSAGASRPSREALAVDFDGIRVLLVEDNLVNQQVATGFLEGFGCRVVRASNGIEAVREEAASVFDLILMDCMMPDMDGYEATGAIRAREAETGRRTPIIALTASALDGNRKRCLAAGMDDFLAKPFRPEGLVAVLRSWAPGRKVAVTEPASADLPELAAATTLDAATIRGFLSFPGGAEILATSITAFRVAMPGEFRGLADAVQAIDRQRMQDLAHRLKSSSGMLGMLDLARVLALIEQRARDATPAELEQLRLEAEASYAAVEPQLAPYASA